VAFGTAQEAVRSLVDFLALDPTHVEALVRLGIWLGELGRPEQAEGSLRRALRLDPEHAGARRS
jgi:Flp pilus assembly protein TadD